MQHPSDSYHAFQPDPARPLAESILPIANGQYVLTQIWPEGVLTARGMLGEDGGFTAVCGSFRSFRPDAQAQ